MIKDVESIFDLSGSDRFKKMFRINYNGMRLYIQNDPFQFYSGLTGALGAATFAGDMSIKRIKSWRENMIDSFGKKSADDFLNATAEFGTLLHMALVRIKENGMVNWNEEREIAMDYFHSVFNGDVSLMRSATYDYQKHVASLLQFVFERVDKIHAIEVPAIWEELRIATPIDLVCSFRPTPKADFVQGCLNIKTSSQITPHHMVQSACEMDMWNSTYPENLVEFTGIVRTKDWREGKVPTFDIKTLDTMEALELSHKAANKLSLCRLDDEATYLPNPTSKRFQGETKAGQVPEIVISSIEEDWAEHWNKEQETDVIHG